MTNGDEPINPDAASNVRTKKLEFGLTKREYFAAMAISGMMANPDNTGVITQWAERAVRYADALIEALNVPVCPDCRQLTTICGYSKEHGVCPTYEKYAGDQP